MARSISNRTGAGGLPLDLESIAPVTAEFDAKPVLVRRVDVSAPQPDLIARVEPLTKPASSTPVAVAEDSAAVPSLPCYWEPSPVSYRSQTPAATQMRELELAFSLLSVSWECDRTCAKYQCSAISGSSFVEFELRLFKDQCDHLVDFTHLSGSRIEFRQVMNQLAKNVPSCPATFACPGMQCAPSFPQTPLTSLPPPPPLGGLSKPSLSRSTESTHTQQTITHLAKSCDEGSFSDRQRTFEALDTLARTNHCEYFFQPTEEPTELYKVLTTELTKPHAATPQTQALAASALAHITQHGNLPHSHSSHLNKSFASGLDTKCPHAQRETLRGLSSMKSEQSSEVLLRVSKLVRGTKDSSALKFGDQLLSSSQMALVR